MKVWKLAAATWLAFFMIVGSAHAEERLTPDERAARVRYETLYAPHSTTTEVVRTITAAAERFHVSSSVMRCIAYRESRYNERAYNSYSGASGLFQHLRSYWPGRVRYYNGHVGDWLKIKPNASPFSMRANSLVTARMMHTGGLGPWGGGC